eukprot:CAMPEP_0171066714 /NCGR_PEP_ID=MMETSP0766_2-20121228/7581_1 /TAXON_ID=439317 /ORGANISM="Gambierdiscus australes, Strain CAWD 149" /LENGTH=155 /DNA_ID=CAMNT_0011522903 /DNA_START=233 /DNA_END=699 /DNA_ORIENTATION=+
MRAEAMMTTAIPMPCNTPELTQGRKRVPKAVAGEFLNKRTLGLAFELTGRAESGAWDHLAPNCQDQPQGSNGTSSLGVVLPGSCSSARGTQEVPPSLPAALVRPCVAKVAELAVASTSAALGVHEGARLAPADAVQRRADAGQTRVLRLYRLCQT